MSELGAERLLGKVRRREVVEAATPHTVGFAALPFGAVALLVVCVGMGDSSGRPGQGDRARSFALSSDLSALARDGAEQMDDAAREGLERAAAAAAGAAAGSGSEEMREVAEELEALALEAPPGSELAEALSRAAAAAESMSLEAGAEDPELDAARQLAEGADSTERRALGEDRGSAPGTGGEEPAARSVEQGAAGADGSGVPDSPGSQAPADGDPSGGEPDSGAPAEESSTRAVLELNWWEPRDEGLVSRWVALQRASATPSQSGQ
jgi:hypothetical protein